jgi:L-seryl-tRNA(Ser) seleniumtransferase
MDAMCDPRPDARYRAIPAVNRLVEAAIALEPDGRWPRSLVIDAARAVIDDQRRLLDTVDPGAGGRAPHGLPKPPASGDPDAPTSTPPDLDQLARRVAERLRDEARPLVPAVINATGVIIHTGLGRAPWPAAAARAAAQAAAGYAAVELDLQAGQRGRRAALLEPLLCRLSGAQAATAVNNNAAALVLTLSALARGRHVIVSRGELIEIGGSFRLPEIMETSGAILHEVGTTNRTRLRDYERAIDQRTALLLKVHPSNYHVEGFVESTQLADLADLGRRRGIPVVHDTGSGLLRPLDGVPQLAGEPDAATSIAHGADIVLFSGDKLLGGPQAGIIVGRADLIRVIEQAPFMRAVRLDKVAIAALGATLRLHLDEETARRDVPVLSMVCAALADLLARAGALVERIRPAVPPGIDLRVEEVPAHAGGGSLPAETLPSAAVRVGSGPVPEDELARRLRSGEPRVLPRVSGGAVYLDLRSVLPAQDDGLAQALVAALAPRCRGGGHWS